MFAVTPVDDNQTAENRGSPRRKAGWPCEVMFNGQGPVRAKTVEVSAKGLRVEVDFHPHVGAKGMVKLDAIYSNRKIAFICAIEVRHVVAKNDRFQFGALILRIDPKPAEFLANYALDLI